MAVRKLEYVVSAQDDGKTVKEILKQKLFLSRREISHAKHFDDGILLDGNHATVAEVVNSGQLIVFNVYENIDDAEEIVPVEGSLDIIYEDKDIIVVNKPANMVVHPVHGHYLDSLCNRIAFHFRENDEQHVMRAVGRLDRETSGVILFCKNRYAASILSGGDEENLSRKKEYLAIVHGKFNELSGTVNKPIGDVPDKPLIRQISEDGKEAVTHYYVEKEYEDYSLVRLKLDTGRTHQIRVHMSSIGHPLVGDSLYLGHDDDIMNRCALHASSLEIIHPVLRKKMFFKAELPDDMIKLINEK